MPEPFEERTAEARAIAEATLLWFLHELKGVPLFIVVLGGLVPEVLTRGQEPAVPPHMGTADVDILLITHVHVKDDYGPVERALETMEFSPAESPWRWRGNVRNRFVKIEFLCDLDDQPEGAEVKPYGCETLTAANLRGTRFVGRDFVWETVSGDLPGGEPATAEVRFAGLEGYLLSKSFAARTRGAEKDYYDLVYVLLHNRAGGPAQAAEQLRRGMFGDELPGMRTTFLELRARFHATGDLAPSEYARGMKRVDPEADEATARADAVAAVREFVDGLGFG